VTDRDFNRIVCFPTVRFEYYNMISFTCMCLMMGLTLAVFQSFGTAPSSSDLRMRMYIGFTRDSSISFSNQGDIHISMVSSQVGVVVFVYFSGANFAVLTHICMCLMRKLKFKAFSRLD